MLPLTAVLTDLLRDVTKFAQHLSGLQLRGYQVQVAQAILTSIRQHRGDSIVVMFPRQSGKNELQAQIECYLLTVMSQMDAELVKVSPTWKPQSLNAMRRLERVLNHNLVTRDRWKKQSGYSYKVGSAQIFFLSGEPHASTVGHTASTLLQCDEAQDVQPGKWDKDFLPMAASTNATRVYWGTAWTSKTLLARELRAAQAAEGRDGRRRAFVLTADDVGREVPAYAAFVADQVAKLGRNHPLIRTQFFSEEIDADGGLFPPARRALMQGTHGWQTAPFPGVTYAFLLDVAGEDETADTTGELSNKGRDSTALTIVAVDLTTVSDPLINAPTYRTVCRYGWTGIKHPRLYAQLKSLAELWQPRHFVADATGVGAGLVTFLDKALPGILRPFSFSSVSKSALGWGFLGIIESRRYQEHTNLAALHPNDMAVQALRTLLTTHFTPRDLTVLCFDLQLPTPAGSHAQQAWDILGECTRRGMLSRLITYGLDTHPELDWSSIQPADDRGVVKHQLEFWRQLEYVEYTAGEHQSLRWSVPNGRRDPTTGEDIHDDWVMAAALCAQLDAEPWSQAHSTVIEYADPLTAMEQNF